MLCRTFAILFFAVAATESRQVREDKEEWLQVNTAQGPVRGRLDPIGELYEFYNIPYATAPTGDKKFTAPLPPPKWTEPFDAVDKGIICPQNEELPFLPPQRSLVMSEDCLIVNVFVPDTNQKNLSVLIYIHGGGFQISHGSWLATTNLMKSKNIIVVNFNYRLGIHGFLCLGTEDAPGNAGMKDQVALLRWVQSNIAAFGGNPNDVTITGYSAGSASVDLHMISKSAEGLFHKVIPESGANLGVWTIQPDPLQLAKDHAKTLNFTNVDDIYDLEKFYKSLSYSVLMADTFLTNIDSTLSFVPCIERDTGDEAYLTESPLSILKRGDYKIVPLLYGFAEMEGIARTDVFELWKDRMNEKFSDFLPANLQFETEDEREKVAKQIKEFYFGDKPIDNDSTLAYVDFYTDTMFAYGHFWALKLHAERGHDQVYLYDYSFVDEDTPFVLHTNVRGAFHCAQTIAVADGKNFTNFNEDDISDEYRNMKKIMREIWRNFVTTGKPVPEGSSLPAWPAAGANGSPYMSLGQEVELRGVLLEERMRFWDNIYQKYYKEPIPPPTPQPPTTQPPTTQPSTTQPPTPQPPTTQPPTESSSSSPYPNLLVVVAAFLFLPFTSISRHLSIYHS